MYYFVYLSSWKITIYDLCTYTLMPQNCACDQFAEDQLFATDSPVTGKILSARNRGNRNWKKKKTNQLRLDNAQNPIQDISLQVNRFFRQQIRTDIIRFTRTYYAVVSKNFNVESKISEFIKRNLNLEVNPGWLNEDASPLSSNRSDTHREKTVWYLFCYYYYYYLRVIRPSLGARSDCERTLVC